MKLRLDKGLLLDGLRRTGFWIAALGLVSFIWTNGVDVSLTSKVGLLVIGVVLMLLGSINLERRE